MPEMQSAAALLSGTVRESTASTDRASKRSRSGADRSIRARTARPAIDPRRRASYRFGVEAENRVARMLHSEGYVLLASRARGQCGEVDLIAIHDDVLAFIEVKARKRGYGGLESVDARKRRRLARASEEWIGKHPEFGHFSVRFDIVLVWPTGLPEYFENAFEAEFTDDFVF